MSLATQVEPLKITKSLTLVSDRSDQEYTYATMPVSQCGIWVFVRVSFAVIDR